MLAIYVETYVQIGQDIQSWIDPSENSLDATVSASDYRTFRRCLTGIEQKCEEVGGLPVLENIIDTVFDGLYNTMTYREIAQAAEKLSDCFQAELRSKRFFLVPSHLAKYNVMFDHAKSQYVYGDGVKPFGIIYFANPNGGEGGRRW